MGSNQYKCEGLYFDDYIEMKHVRIVGRNYTPICWKINSAAKGRRK